MQNTNKSNNLKRSPETSNDIKKPQMTSKKENDKPLSEKIKSKKNLKGVDPNDNPSNGIDLFEQDFSSI